MLDLHGLNRYIKVLLDNGIMFLWDYPILSGYHYSECPSSVQSIQQTDQLFVCYGGQNRSHALSRQGDLGDSS